MTWSYRYTGRSSVTAENVVEATINIYEDGELRLENLNVTGAPSDLATLCSTAVTQFAGQYEAYVSLPEINTDEVVVIA